MPRPRFKKLDPDKQAKILDAAEEEFLSKGFGGASLNEIMKDLGISKGAAYYYFDDKADLFGACLSRLLRKVEIFLTSVTLDFESDNRFWQSMNKMCVDMLQLVVHDLQWQASFRLFMTASSDPKLMHLLHDIHEPYEAWVLAIVIRAQERKFLRQDLDPKLASRLWMNIGMTFDQWLMECYATTGEWGDLNGIASNYCDLIRRALAPI